MIWIAVILYVQAILFAIGAGKTFEHGENPWVQVTFCALNTIAFFSIVRIA